MSKIICGWIGETLVELFDIVERLKLSVDVKELNATTKWLNKFAVSKTMESRDPFRNCRIGYNFEELSLQAHEIYKRSQASF
jgi:hypothetical protein